MLFEMLRFDWEVWNLLFLLWFSNSAQWNPKAEEGIYGTRGGVRVLSGKLQLLSDKSNLGFHPFFNCSFMFFVFWFFFKDRNPLLETLNTVCFIYALRLLVLSPKYILIIATPHSLLRLSTCHFSPGWLCQPPLPPCSLAQGSASFSAKDQVVNLVGSVDHIVPAAVTEHLIKSAVVAPV